MTQIFAIDEQRIERQEVRPVAPVEQVIEAARSIRCETGDFAVENDVACSHGVRNLFCQYGQLL